MQVEATRRPAGSTVFRLFVYFQRIVAAACLGAGLRYWALLSGVFGNDLWRFDLMPTHWQVASAALAVLFPVAAIGLWMPVSWGAVVWFVAAVTETAMYLGFPHLFGHQPITPILHGVVAVIYVALRIAVFFEKRRSRQPVRYDSP